MKIKRLLLAMFLPMLFVAFPALAQDKTVTGKVTDAKDGAAIQGVSVLVKSTKSTGTQTASDGTFKIKVNNGAILVFSSVGYVSQEVAANDNVVNVSLTANSTGLGDVVVVAYGTRRKTDLTGSVVSVGAKDFQKGNIASSEQLLIGKVAGLQVTPGGGSAGGGSLIRIRGGASVNASNDPLVVIDGMPVEGNGAGGNGNLLGTINPNDIESYTVLKDASATALYGARASNGVIIITTKKGSKGRVKFNFSTQFISSSASKKPEVLNGDEVRSIVNADAARTGDSKFKNLLGTANTDWQDAIYRNTFSVDNNLNASGMVAKIPFRASVGYLTQQGILKTNQYDRLTLGLNLNPKFFNDKLSVNVQLKGSTVKNRLADEGAIGAAVNMNPTQPIYATGKFGGYYETLQSNGLPAPLATRNPLGLLELRNNTNTTDRFIGNIQLDYELPWVKGLHAQANLGTDLVSLDGKDIRDSASAANGITSVDPSSNGLIAGSIGKYKSRNTNQLAEFSLFYSKELKEIKSKFDVLVLHGFQSFRTNVDYFRATTQRGNDTIPGSGALQFANDQFENKILSYLGRINYSYNNKYLLTASIRNDASSRFSPSNRNALFTAVALGWKIKDDFFKRVKEINELKLRASVGTTGQQDGIGNYDYLARYTRSGNVGAQYQLGSQFYGFLRPSAYDANRKWESTTTYNYGIDFSLFSSRVSGSFDYFTRTTNDLLFYTPIAPGSNFDIGMVKNVGEATSKGYEFTLNLVPVRTKDWNWDISFNMAYNEIEMKKLTQFPVPGYQGLDVNNISGGTGNTIAKMKEGYAPNSFFVYQQVYDNKTGKPIEGLYNDLNRDGKVDNNDRRIFKKPTPDMLFGFSTNVGYKKWNFGLAAHGQNGNYLYNNYFANSGTLNSIQNPIGNVNNASRDYLTTGFRVQQYLSDYYIQNASFFRIDNINVAYNVGKISKGVNLRLGATVQNVLLITEYKGADPELASTSGIDNNIYARPRVFSLLANFDF